MGKLDSRYFRRLSSTRGRGERKPRPKTFADEKAAEAWAKAQGMKAYVLVNLRSPESKQKKIRVEAKA